MESLIGVERWALGLLAGGTILLGLPVARLRNVSVRSKAFLNAVSTGVLVFLLVEMSGHLIEELEELVEGAIQQGTSLLPAVRSGGVLALGFALGLLGLVWFERRFLHPTREGVAPRPRDT